MSIACPFKAMKTAKSVGIGISNDGKSDGSVKYCEVSDLLRKEILAGKYSPGSAFPSLKMICRRFGVSYLTAVRATESLKELGLVRSKNGVGTFVKRRMMTVWLVMPMLKQVEVYPPICQEFSRLCLEKGVAIDFADISALRSDPVRPVVVAAASKDGRGRRGGCRVPPRRLRRPRRPSACGQANPLLVHCSAQRRTDGQDFRHHRV